MNLLLYMAKCVAGGLIVYGLASWLHYADFGWCLVSVMLVLSPDEREAIPFAFTRIRANLIGGALGFLCLLLGPVQPLTLSLAFILTILLCHIARLMTGVRSALAAAIIIMLHGPDGNSWHTLRDRLLSVVVGCAIGLLVTFIFHRGWRSIAPNTGRAGDTEY